MHQFNEMKDFVLARFTNIEHAESEFWESDRTDAKTDHYTLSAIREATSALVALIGYWPGKKRGGHGAQFIASASRTVVDTLEFWKDQDLATEYLIQAAKAMNSEAMEFVLEEKEHA